MRVAFDTQVPKATLEEARKNGFDVVYWAGAEHDEYWFREAVELGADVFVSPDWDIACLANRANRGFIRLKRTGLRGDKLVQSIIARLKFCEKQYRMTGRYPELI